MVAKSCGLKRGQVAMEFLMTYGWAIIIILLAIAALWLLGVFSPSTPTICQMDAPFSCQDAVIGTQGLTFKLGISAQNTGQINSVQVNGQACNLIEKIVKPNVPLTVSCNGLSLEDNEKVVVTVDASYSSPGGLTHSIEGELSGSATKGEERYIQTYSSLSLCSDPHGFGNDGSSFYFSCNGLVTITDENFQTQSTVTVPNTDIHTGVTYDKKNNVFWGIDFGSGPAITKFADNTFSTTLELHVIGNDPIDITSDGTYLYTNDRHIGIRRHLIDSSIGNDGTLDMNALSGFDWGGQGITYLNGYLYAGTSPYGVNGGRIYVLDISDWNNPRIIDWWKVQDLTDDISGLTNDGQHIYAVPRQVAGPVVKYSIPSQW